MAHRIETKVGQGVSYQLEVGGTPPIDCTVVVGPPGIAIDPVTKILTVPGASFTEARNYPASVQCQNCSGSTDSLSIQISVSEDINCTPIPPPTTVRQQFVYNTAPVRVPTNMVGIHAAAFNGSTENPTPTFSYDFIRSHDGTTNGQGGDQADAAIGCMWRGIEYAPGQYDFGPARRWALKFDKPILWTLFATPEFYVKYTDASWAAFQALGAPQNRMLYPGIGNFNSPPNDPQRLVDFARALVNDPVLGPRIYALELWNEAMLPWDSTPRWNASYGMSLYNSNQVGWPQPWFSGTAGDMAGMAKALKDANLGKPLYACGFVDCSSGVAGQYSFDRMLNGTAGGVALKDMIEATTIHWYDYAGEDLNTFVRDMTNYRSRLDALGKPNLPMMNTETGDYGGTMSATQLQRLILVAAATKLQGLALYRYSNDDAGHHMGDPVTNAATRAGITAARNAVSGKTICEAAVLSDGRIWVHTADGQQFTV